MRPSQRFLVAITVLNVAITAVSLSQLPQAQAAAEPAPVLRGRALEIVDERGRIRASIQVHPADPRVKLPDGRTQAEAVVLRLVNAEGGPGVKIASAQNDAGMALIVGQGNYLQLSTGGLRVTRESKLQAAWP